MSINTEQIREYNGFQILPIPQQGGYMARIRRPNGAPMICDGIEREAWDTMVYPDDASAVEQAQLAIDGGIVSAKPGT